MSHSASDRSGFAGAVEAAVGTARAGYCMAAGHDSNAVAAAVEMKTWVTILPAYHDCKYTCVPDSGFETEADREAAFGIQDAHLRTPQHSDAYTDAGVGAVDSENRTH